MIATKTEILSTFCDTNVFKYQNERARSTWMELCNILQYELFKVFVISVFNTLHAARLMDCKAILNFAQIFNHKGAGLKL